MQPITWALTSVLVLLGARFALAAAFVRVPVGRWRRRGGPHRPTGIAMRRSASANIAHLSAARLAANRLHYVLLLLGLAIIAVLNTGQLSRFEFATACGLLALLAAYRYRWPRDLYSATTGRESVAYGQDFIRYHYPYGLARALLIGPVVALPWLVGLVLLAVPGLLLADPGHLAQPPLSYVSPSGSNAWSVGAGAVAVGAGLLTVVDLLERSTRRRALARSSEVVGSPGQDIVLMLRQFGAEGMRVRAHVGPRRFGLTRILPEFAIPLEDSLAWILWSTFRVVAIRDPRMRRQATLGAAHHVVDPDEHWQEVVRELAERATLVVLVLGERSGIRWELEAVLRNHRLRRKAVVINPPGGDPSAFTQSVSRCLPGTHAITPDVGLPLLGVYFPDGKPVTVHSSDVQDVDYESAIEYVLQEIGEFRIRRRYGLDLRRD